MALRRILVTGATGFIGVEVARQLAEAGVPARLMVHRPHRAAYVRAFSRDLVAGDLGEPGSLDPALMRGVSAVIHLGGRATFEAYRVLRPTLVGGTAALARAAADAGASRFVFASSTLVYAGDSADGAPADASTPTAPWSGYGRAKLEAERALTDIAGGAMTLAVLRLPHVYGPRDMLFGMARRRWLVSPGPGSSPFSHLHVHDAAAALIRAARQDWSGASPIADAVPASWSRFLALLRDTTPGLRVLRVPAPAAWLGAHVTAEIARRRDRPTIETPDGVTGWNRSLVVARDALWPLLGLRPRYPSIDSGVPAAAAEAIPADWVHSLRDHRT